MINQLEWTAFQYVADELPAAARERFEMQLLEDQAAREALASAVRMWDLFQAARPEVHLSQPPRRLTAAWLAVGSALSLLAVLLGQWLMVGSPESLLARHDTHSLDQLAQAWSETRSEPARPEWLTADDNDPASDGDELAVEAAELQISSWMLAAVAQQAGQIESQQE